MAKQQTPYRMTALADIKPYDRNPRIIPQAAVDAVARSIQAFGFRQPIVVDGNGVILAGHTRHKAAQQLGMTEVPVVWQTDITDIQARGYRIADNKVAELSAWDRDALDAEVRELADLGDIDIGAVGLADWELERIVQETSADEPARQDLEYCDGRRTHTVVKCSPQSQQVSPSGNSESYEKTVEKADLTTSYVMTTLFQVRSLQTDVFFVPMKEIICHKMISETSRPSHKITTSAA